MSPADEENPRGDLFVQSLRLARVLPRSESKFLGNAFPNSGGDRFRHGRSIDKHAPRRIELGQGEEVFAESLMKPAVEFFEPGFGVCTRSDPAHGNIGWCVENKG